MTEKHALRRELLAQRDAISLRDKRVWDAAINKAIVGHVWFQQAETILAYYPIGSEPDIRPALEEALRQGKALYLPKCKPETREMTIHQVSTLQSMKPGAHGIPEPEANNCQLSTALPPVVSASLNCQLCLVPGIAFDADGFRLGYGGGYYDRFLARHRELNTLGVCYELLRRAALPSEAMDIAVMRVLSEGEQHEHRGQEE